VSSLPFCEHATWCTAVEAVSATETYSVFKCNLAVALQIPFYPRDLHTPEFGSGNKTLEMCSFFQVQIPQLSSSKTFCIIRTPTIGLTPELRFYGSLQVYVDRRMIEKWISRMHHDLELGMIRQLAKRRAGKLPSCLLSELTRESEPKNRVHLWQYFKQKHHYLL
jgi:hypothetical protein